MISTVDDDDDDDDADDLESPHVVLYWYNEASSVRNVAVAVNVAVNAAAVNVAAADAAVNYCCLCCC